MNSTERIVKSDEAVSTPPESPKIECEGAGALVHFPNFAQGMCPMCGEWVAITNDERAIRHWRYDILTMIDRGDFDV